MKDQQYETHGRYQKKTGRSKKKNRHRLVLAVLVICAALAGICAAYVCAQREEAAKSGGEASGPVSADQTSGTDNMTENPASQDAVTYEGKTWVPNDHLSNYLLLGIDASEDLGTETTKTAGTGGQADAIYLVSYDRAEKTRTIFAIPRDTMTEIETFSPDGTSLGTAKNHLSLQYAYGDGRRKSCELMVTAVSKLFYGLKIDGYAALDLDSIPRLTELVDYVDVTVPDDSLEEVNPSWKKGETAHLTPDNTEMFVRYRDTDTDQSAIVRMNRQKAFISAFADRVRQLQSEDASAVTTVYNGLRDKMLTSMSNDLFLDLEEAESTGDILTIPGEGGSGDLYDEYYVDDDGMYDLMIRHFYRARA